MAEEIQPPHQKKKKKSGMSPRSGAPGTASGRIWVPSARRCPAPGAEEVTSECQLRNPLGWQRLGFGRGGGGDGGGGGEEGVALG